MVRALSAFLDFCYLVRRPTIDNEMLDAIDDALARFHENRVIFEECGVRTAGFSLPRQHSLVHYRRLIQAFRAPNGLCSSITESKHIKAVKEPWRRSSRFEALGQMLVANQRLDKLVACRVDFGARHMLDGPCLRPTTQHRELVAPIPIPIALVVEDDAVEGSHVMVTVTLSKTPGKSLFIFSIATLTPNRQRASTLELYTSLRPRSVNLVFHMPSDSFSMTNSTPTL